MPRLISDATANQLGELLRAPPARASGGPGALSQSCFLVKCGTLISSSPQAHYNGTVQWAGSLAGPSDATGAADGVILADLDAGTLTPGSVYLAYLSGTASDGRPILWCRESGDGASAGDCSGCGWVAGLTDLDCLLATVVERLGRCACAPAGNDEVYLASADGETWTAAEGTVTICGVEYALTFSREGCDGPCLTLTSDGGTAVYAVRDCCGPNYAIFSIGNVAVCSGTTDTEAGPAGNVARVKVEWTCCLADGYDGPGYYCVRDAGSEDECAAVEVLSAEDVCASEVEICAGPFETLEEAQTVCGAALPGEPGATCETALGGLVVGTVYSGIIENPVLDPPVHQWFKYGPLAAGSYSFVPLESPTNIAYEIGFEAFCAGPLCTGGPCIEGVHSGSSPQPCYEFTITDAVNYIYVHFNFVNFLYGPSSNYTFVLRAEACP
jgi:hypothetical protein